MKITINQALVLGKTIKERINELRSLRNSSLTRVIYFDTVDSSKEKRVEEPQYDPKKVDRKCVELENFIFAMDSAIKQANAQTIVDIDGDVKTLLSPLE